jgi:hypothetical protein
MIKNETDRILNERAAFATEPERAGPITFRTGRELF